MTGWGAVGWRSFIDVTSPLPRPQVAAMVHTQWSLRLRTALHCSRPRVGGSSVRLTAELPPGPPGDIAAESVDDDGHRWDARSLGHLLELSLSRPPATFHIVPRNRFLTSDNDSSFHSDCNAGDHFSSILVIFQFGYAVRRVRYGLTYHSTHLGHFGDAVTHV